MPQSSATRYGTPSYHKMAAGNETKLTPYNKITSPKLQTGSVTPAPQEAPAVQEMMLMQKVGLPLIHGLVEVLRVL